VDVDYKSNHIKSRLYFFYFRFCLYFHLIMIFFMVSKVLNFNLNYVIYLLFQLNILHVEPHQLKEGLSPYVRGSVRI
jgi:hypothetical protein